MIIMMPISAAIPPELDFFLLGGPVGNGDVLIYICIAFFLIIGKVNRKRIAQFGIAAKVAADNNKRIGDLQAILRFGNPSL